LDRADEIKQDAINFVRNSEKMNDQDKVELLVKMFDKYLQIYKSDYYMGHHDMRSIIEGAIGKFREASLPTYIEGKRVSPTEQNNLCIMEAAISFLNSQDLLKRVPKFKYTDA